MSFILDALKKSEAERQRKSTPGFADVPGPREASATPRWLWAVGALLAINLAVLLVLLLRPVSDAIPAGTVTQVLELPVSPPTPSLTEVVSAATETRREAAAAPDDIVSPVPAPAAAPEAARAKPRIDMDSLSTFEQLRATGALQLPDLHVDLHVWGERAADRFVVINMSRYKEGATLEEGPRVLEIMSNGIVLEHRGTRFFLPSP